MKNTHIINAIKCFDLRHYKKRCLLGICALLTLSLLTIVQKLPNEKIPIAKFYQISSKKQNSIKTILYWNTFHGEIDMGLGLGENIFKNCPISTCFTTSNKTYLPIEEFDAIIFHGARYNIKEDSIPALRSIHQKYIFLSLESPFNNNFEKRVNNFFYNWTMTYRKDSDIHYPYNLIQETLTNYTPPTYEKLRNKKKLVAWFVSQCWTPGSKRRIKYAKHLEKYIEVDIYGDCGNLTCRKNDSEKCYKMLERDYYFYLSFENSQCADYVTEKLYNVLELDVVPVVLGYGDYNNNAPPR